MYHQRITIKKGLLTFLTYFKENIWIKNHTKMRNVKNNIFIAVPFLQAGEFCTYFWRQVYIAEYCS